MKIQGALTIHKSVPISHHIKTAFGTMKCREAVFIIIEDETGKRGIGDSWVNFPVWAPPARLAMYERAIIPAIEGEEVTDIPEFTTRIYERLLGQALQSGTVGPLLQGICGLELALWDLRAQREELPLCRLLFTSPKSKVRIYASGINSPIPFDLIDEYLDRGVTLFKLKLGFSEYEDRSNLDTLCSYLKGRAEVAVDVNRGWDMETAVHRLPILSEYNVKWIEEPLRPPEEARIEELRTLTGIHIAGGENVMIPPGPLTEGTITTEKRRRSAGIVTPSLLDSGFDIVQPDITKYAPLHKACEMIHHIEGVGKIVVPHFLGPAPGQAASLHFAAGCREGLAEWDINRNPLRTDFLSPAFDIRDGCIEIPDKPGLGWQRIVSL